MTMSHSSADSTAEPFSNSGLPTHKNAPVLTPMHNVTFNIEIKWTQLCNIREIKDWEWEAGLKLYSYRVCDSH